jgi:AcrR family transcriptional regulator
MPRTRPELDRDAKVAEILGVAERRLRDGGYDALSVAGIARELGLAQNAVYWYFPSKDHLLVAALERMLRDIVARKSSGQRSLESKVLWFVDQLAEIEDVRAALQERARVSPVAAEFAGLLDSTSRQMLGNVLRSRVPAAELDEVVAVLVAAIRGVLLERGSAAERRRVISAALRRLT